MFIMINLKYLFEVYFWEIGYVCLMIYYVGRLIFSLCGILNKNIL